MWYRVFNSVCFFFEIYFVLMIMKKKKIEIGSYACMGYLGLRFASTMIGFIGFRNLMVGQKWGQKFGFLVRVLDQYGKLFFGIFIWMFYSMDDLICRKLKELFVVVVLYVIIIKEEFVSVFCLVGGIIVWLVFRFRCWIRVRLYVFFI